MRESAFDDFYRSTRQRTLHETHLLTGDLTAAARATREAYVVAWHHWNKVGALPDPVAWVRPLAWRMAQRRHAGRIWHRPARMSDAQAETMEGLHALRLSQRRLVLLVHAAGLPLADAAREVALTAEAAETRLREAETALTTRWSCAPSDIPGRLEAVLPVAPTTLLPRTPIVMRAGRRRRRVQAASVAAGVLGLTLVAGTLAALPDGAGDPAPLPDSSDSDEPTLADTLLTTEQLREAVPGSAWRVSSTTDNTAGEGITAPCQPQRFADPEGIGSLVRTFRAGGRPLTAVQTTEVSADEKAGTRTYDTVVGWFAACATPRVQLAQTYRIRGVGDEAVLFRLQASAEDSPAHLVAVGRSDEAVTSLVLAARDPRTLRPQAMLRTFAAAMRSLCIDELCVASPRLEPRLPLPASGPARMLSVVDLPALPGLLRPWVGTDADPARRANPASTPCDETSFTSAARARTRTFVPPGANVPVRFGLTQTYGVFASPDRARAVYDRAAQRLGSCAERDRTADVAVSLPGLATRSLTYRAWDVVTEVDEDSSVRFRVWLVRYRDTVSEVTFVPSDRLDLSPGQLRALVVRTAERLRLGT